MNVIEALQQLGFTFWQVLVVIVFLIFQKNIRNILDRLSSVKIGDNEILLSNRKELVDSLNEVKDELEQEGINNSSIRDKIDSKIRNKKIGALINIKNNSPVLWKSLLRNLTNREVFEVPISFTVMAKIDDDLALLEKQNYISIYQTQSSSVGNSYYLRLNIISDEFESLVQNAKEF